MSGDAGSQAATGGQQEQQSLSTAAARNPATLTKSVPQIQEIISRWLPHWVECVGTGPYGDEAVLAIRADGAHLGGQALVSGDALWEVTARAATACTVLVLSRADVPNLAERATSLGEHLAAVALVPRQHINAYGEAVIDVSAGHVGDPVIPHTFVDYEVAPREYELSMTQTVLKVHTRVADPCNQPMDQTEQQLRLTVRGGERRR